MYVTVETEREARISEKFYPLATVLNPRPNRSIRAARWPRATVRVISITILAVAAWALIVLAN